MTPETGNESLLFPQQGHLLAFLPSCLGRTWTGGGPSSLDDAPLSDRLGTVGVAITLLDSEIDGSVVPLRVSVEMQPAISWISNLLAEMTRRRGLRRLEPLEVAGHEGYCGNRRRISNTRIGPYPSLTDEEPTERFAVVLSCWLLES